MARWPMKLQGPWVLSGMLCLLVGVGAPAMVQAAGVSGSRHGNKALQAQLHDVQAKVSRAHDRNAELQAQVAKMERESAEREKRLKQRDDEIAALQRKLDAAGAPASSASAGH
ncbi:MAG TPA: hypothetical protein VJ862_06185 [Rhodanobacteraceae bacterium]|nr:hypothetical protein [Rhodanobacteraceae bacterium]